MTDLITRRDRWPDRRLVMEPDDRLCLSRNGCSGRDTTWKNPRDISP